MNRRWVLAVLPVLLLVAVVQAAGVDRGREQDSSAVALKRVEEAFARGDARALSETSADHIEISVFGNSTLFSRGQAQYVLQDFFADYPPERFALGEPTRAGSSLFASGTFVNRSVDRQLQVFVRLRERGGDWELREVRVERRARE